MQSANNAHWRLQEQRSAVEITFGTENWSWTIQTVDRIKRWETKLMMRLFRFKGRRRMKHGSNSIQDAAKRPERYGHRWAYPFCTVTPAIADRSGRFTHRAAPPQRRTKCGLSLCIFFSFFHFLKKKKCFFFSFFFFFFNVLIVCFNFLRLFFVFFFRFCFRFFVSCFSFFFFIPSC